MQWSNGSLWPQNDVEVASEKQFYLEEFRGRTVVLAATAEELAEGEATNSVLASVIRELLDNNTRVLVLLSCDNAQNIFQLIGSRGERRNWVAPRASRIIDSHPLVQQLSPSTGYTVDASLLIHAWLALRKEQLFFLLAAGASRTTLLELATDLAAKLRVHKLVLMEPEGGIADPRGQTIPFMDAGMIDAVLEVGQAEWAGLGHRRAVFAAVRRALAAGVGSVNLCRLEQLAEELFTYSGSGTLFTFSDYCSIERLGIDDFPEVERLLDRGVREGLLKPRTPEEVARFLLQAYGAVVGKHHLAGVCALETELYRFDQAGEVIGLYTITRFKGEGIGRKLLARVLTDARMLGLRYVFACTTVPSAQAFFVREGFQVVAPSEVPATKWERYPPERRQRVVVLRLDLDTPR